MFMVIPIPARIVHPPLLGRKMIQPDALAEVEKSSQLFLITIKL